VFVLTTLRDAFFLSGLRRSCRRRIPGVPVGIYFPWNSDN
jgi:hypothetical protein